MRELGVGKERDEAAPRWAARLRRNGGEQGGARLARVFATAKELRRRESFVQQGALRLGALEGKTALGRSEEHTSELQSLMRISYAVFCLKKKKKQKKIDEYLYNTKTSATNI